LYGLSFGFTTAANMNPLLTDEDFYLLMSKVRASDSTTVVDYIDFSSLLWCSTRILADGMPLRGTLKQLLDNPHKNPIVWELLRYWNNKNQK
jgi:hypothetical protein